MTGLALALASGRTRARARARTRTRRAPPRASSTFLEPSRAPARSASATGAPRTPRRFRGEATTVPATGASAKLLWRHFTGISRPFWREQTCCAHPRARPRCRWRRAPSCRAASASRRVALGASAWRVARRSREPRPRATGPGRRTTTPPRGRHRRRRLLPPRRPLLRPRRTVAGRRSRSSASPRRAKPPPVGSCGPPKASPRARA